VLPGRVRLLIVLGVFTATACSGSGDTTSPSGSASSRPAAVRQGDAASAGTACRATHFRLEAQATAERRARAKVADMSLQQEISLMHGGGLNAGPAGAVGASEAIPSQHIPAVNQDDGPAGVGDFETGVTQLPAPIALAATFDRAAARCYGQVIGTEARAKGIELMYGPTVNLVRLPQWGRTFESLGEDPVLSGTLGAAEINGTQRTGVMAEAKHFAVYNQETARNTPADDAIVGRRALQELYLKVWRYVVAAHPAAIMCSYSTINHQPACQDAGLLRGYLNRRLGYRGFVGSDYLATHSTTPAVTAGLDQEQPSAQFFGRRLLVAVRSGRVPRRFVDQAARRILAQMYRFRLFSDYPTGDKHSVVSPAAGDAVAEAVAEQGTVLLKNSPAALPLPASGSLAVIGTPATTESATTGGGTATVESPRTTSPLQGIREAAPSGVAVTYRPGLPATASLRPIPSTDLDRAYPSTGSPGAFHATLTAPATGSYIFGVQTSRYFTPASLLLDGQPLLTNPDSRPLSTYTAAADLVAGHRYQLSITGASTALTWAPPSAVEPAITAAARAAARAKTAVVVVADPQQSEAADRATLTLPSAQDQLVHAVAAANPRTVVVVQSGGAVSMPWLPQVAAVVDQWFPGQVDGTSLAAVLFGAVNPSGHLPITFPASLAQTPAASARQFPGRAGRVHYSEGVNVGYRWWIDTRHRPLFPFGFGLSYTSFRYGKPRVHVVRGGAHPVVRVTSRVSNVGRRGGADVAQLYVGSPVAAEPARQLVGYRRVAIPAGKTVPVSFRIGAYQLAVFVGGDWRVPAGAYRIYVGDSSARAQLRAAAPISFG
jgi:beta-glucosidase